MVRAPRGHHSAQHPRLPSDVRGGPAVVSGPAPDRRFPGGARAPASARPWVRVRRSGARRRGPLCGESVNRCGPHKGRSPHPLGSRERTRVWAKQLPRPGRSPHVAFVGDCLRRPTPHPWLGLLETPCGVQRRARPSSALLGPPHPSSPPCAVPGRPEGALCFGRGGTLAMCQREGTRSPTLGFRNGACRGTARTPIPWFIHIEPLMRTAQPQKSPKGHGTR